MDIQSLSTVQRLAAETLNRPLDAMAPAITFREAGIDSLSTIDLVFAVEGHFDITLPPDELQQLRSLSDLAASVDRLTTREARRYG
ncbi:MAG: acyl carrier protein [Gammaproteobacteria bacterium]